jgi:hypothetical protein
MISFNIWGRGRALRIAVGLMMLALILAGGAVASAPTAITFSPTDAMIQSIAGDTIIFTVTFNQTANVTWYINSNPLNYSGIIPAGTIIGISYTPSSPGNYNVSVSATNENGTDTEYWNWSVHSTNFFTDNRIWDGSRPNDFSLNYTWTPQSFSGFYYNAKDDVGSESLTMKMDSYTSRTIQSGNIDYSTTPQDVSFAHTAWGTYQVIGFMADKYFAGYTANTTLPNPTTLISAISLLAQGRLHKVLIDDDTTRTISMGGTIALG